LDVFINICLFFLIGHVLVRHFLLFKQHLSEGSQVSLYAFVSYYFLLLLCVFLFVFIICCCYSLFRFLLLFFLVVIMRIYRAYGVPRSINRYKTIGYPT
jgi:hypothetical protein